MRTPIPRDLLRRAGIAALLAMPALACTSSNQLTTLETKLDDVSVQLLQLQKLVATGEELEALRGALDERMQGVLASDVDLATEVRRLATQIEQLEAKLEDNQFRLAQLSQQLAATTQELQAVRVAAEARSTAARPPPSRRGPVSAPQALYERAYNDYLNGNYDLAILGFEQYLESQPSIDLADNATYWIGESYYRQGQYQQAIAQFDEVLTRYPGSDRIPSALLKKGYAYLELGQRAQGVVHLQSVICEYPGSDEARIARQRLEELGIDAQC